MMDLDEAIQSFEDEMEKQTALGHPENIDNLEQMSEWLKELKAYRENTCGDAISREAVLKIIDGWYDNNRDTENIEDLIVLITYMPSVTPQPKMGRWLQKEEEGDAEPFIIWKCSECHEYQRKQTTYCPDCGIKMEVDNG